MPKKVGPERIETFNASTKMWELTLIPPAWSGFSPSQISLTKLQYERYQTWLKEGSLIQEVFPELTPAQREMLVSGINEEEWKEFMGDE